MRRRCRGSQGVKGGVEGVVEGGADRGGAVEGREPGGDEDGDGAWQHLFLFMFPLAAGALAWQPIANTKLA